MNSAPAVLRLPCLADMNEAAYPWAVNTPEASPRLWGVEPKLGLAAQLPRQHMILPDEFQRMCTPIYEQMFWHVACNADVLRSLGSTESRESVQIMCQPYFEDVITTLHQALQYTHPDQESQSMQNMKHSLSFESVFQGASLAGHWDDASTDADEACAFASLLSSPTSEGDHVSNEDSEPSSDIEKSIMVCRHWKSKGFCRMESRCKFLHPEAKRGDSIPNSHSGSAGKVDGTDTECATLAISSGRHKKRGGKNRSKKGQAGQLGSFEAAVPGPECFRSALQFLESTTDQEYAASGEHYNECFPCLVIA